MSTKQGTADKEKQKYYNLGSMRATQRIARKEHKCNCCATVIGAGEEYREVQKLPNTRHKGGSAIHLHVECFRSLMRNLRNSIEMLTIANNSPSTMAPTVFDECPKPFTDGHAASDRMDKLD